MFLNRFTAFPFLLVVWLGFSAAHAQEAELKEEAQEEAEQESPEKIKARELLKIFGIEAGEESGLAAEDLRAEVEGMMLPMFENMELDEESMKAYEESIDLAVQEAEKVFAEMSYETLYLDAYAEAFSVEELQQLIDFYRSPVAQKMLSLDEEIETRYAAEMMEDMIEMQQRMTDKIQDRLQKE